MEFLRTTLMASSSDSTCFSEGAGTGASAVVSATGVEASSSDILLLFSSSLVITSTLKLIDYLRVLWCFFWPSPANFFLVGFGQLTLLDRSLLLWDSSPIFFPPRTDEGGLNLTGCLWCCHSWPL